MRLGTLPTVAPAGNLKDGVGVASTAGGWMQR